MSKYKALKKEQVEIVAEKLKYALNELNTANTYQEAFISIGYTKGTIERLLKQLKGELPII